MGLCEYIHIQLLCRKSIYIYTYIYIYIHKGRTITITDVVSIVTKCAVSLANDLKVVDQGTLMQIMKISLYVRVHIKIIP